MSEKLTNRQVDQYMGFSNFANRLQGKPENGTGPIEDPAEAYEVAHATKEHEEKYVALLGYYAGIKSADIDNEGNVTNRYPGNGDEANVARHSHTTQSRIAADRLGDQVGEAYKNGAEFLDLSSDEFTNSFAKAPVYRKSTLVKARPAVAGEVIVTTTPDGVEEGRNTAGEGDTVITGANGADFILPNEKFNKLYGATENDGEYQARGMARIIDNPTGKKIGILAPWGEMQYGDKNAKLAVQFDPENPDVVGTDRYVLDAKEFAVYEELEPTA